MKKLFYNCLFAFSFVFLSSTLSAQGYVASILPQNPCAGDSVIITISNGGNPNSGFFIQLWNFGDGGMNQWYNPIGHIYTTPGLYSGFAVIYDSVTGVDTIPFSVFVGSVCPGLDIITGTVYDDQNNNGAQDPGEWPMANRQVRLTPGPNYTTTNSMGEYAFVVNAGTYTIEAIPPTYYSVTEPVSGNYSVTTTGSSATFSGNDFGLHASPANDLMVTMYAAPPVPNINRTYSISYHNVGTTSLTGSIVLTHQTGFTFVSATPTPTSQVGNVTTWNYSSLLPGNSGHLSIVLHVPSGLTLGTPTTQMVVGNPVVSDSTPLNNSDTLNQVVVASYDPNEKKVSPIGVGISGQIAGNQRLEYTIGFQNTGTYYATDVILRDTLDTDLNFESITILGSSHPLTGWSLDQGTLTFQFLGIMLPDSNMNEPASHGWVKYTMMPKAGLPDGTTITNTASIYFDFNAPVVTNTVSNEIEIPTVSISHGALENGVKLYPNPFSTQTVLSFDNDSNEGFQLKVFDMSGKSVRTESGIKSNTVVFERNNLPAGMYSWKLQGESGRIISGKMMIQ